MMVVRLFRALAALAVAAGAAVVARKAMHRPHQGWKRRCALVAVAAAVAVLAAPAAAWAPANQPIGLVNYPRPADFPMYVTPQLTQSCINHGLLPDCGGEPSIGVDRFTKNAMLQMMLTTARVRWDDTHSPPTATWENVSDTEFITTGDPFLWTDPATGRSFELQLRGFGGQVAFTDDDGASWSPIVVVQTPQPDHPTLATGPYHQPAPPGAGTVYPNAVYYCARGGAPVGTLVSYCRRSDDGGVTWGPATLMNPGQADCWFPNAGHVTVGLDGSVYVPHKWCGGQQGVFISRDNGQTWALRKVPGTLSTDRNFSSEPKVAFDGAGRLYFVASSNGKPLVVTSDDGGEHWAPPVEVGKAFGIQATEFPVVVAGDAGRAAFAFLATTTPGQSENEHFEGVWHLYVASTLDGGASWDTVNATPQDPVQRGCISFNLDGFCDKRNLLDFNDMTVDAEGRVLVAYTDGCVSETCVGPNGTPDDSRASQYVIARQWSGRRLFAAFDP